MVSQKRSWNQRRSLANGPKSEQKRKMKMQTLSKTLVEVQANAPVDTLFETC